jgi:hypothetical protein
MSLATLNSSHTYGSYYLPFMPTDKTIFGTSQLAMYIKIDANLILRRIIMMQGPKSSQEIPEALAASAPLALLEALLEQLLNSPHDVAELLAFCSNQLEIPDRALQGYRGLTHQTEVTREDFLQYLNPPRWCKSFVEISSPSSGTCTWIKHHKRKIPGEGWVLNLLSLP